MYWQTKRTARNLAATINAALPNAAKIGFTGTPLLKTQKMDQAFGGYIDQYKINEAVNDGATVRIIRFFLIHNYCIF